MKSFSASDAKRNFGDVLLKVQSSPIGIDKNGKPVAVMLSADTYAEMQRMQRALLQQNIDESIADLKAGRVSDGKELLAGLKHSVSDAEL